MGPAATPRSRRLLGFTMLEMAVVVAVLGVVVAAAVPAYQHFTAKMRVAAAERQVTLILAQARAIKAQERTLSWADAVELSIRDIAPEGEPFHAADTDPAPRQARPGVDFCALEGGTAFGSYHYRCSPGAGTRVEGDTVYADPTKWVFTINPTGWRAMSLHTRHIIVQDHGSSVTVQIAAGDGVWVYGRVWASGSAVSEPAHPTTTTTTTTTTLAPPPTTEPTSPTTVPDPGDDGDPMVWPEENDPDDEDGIAEVVEGADGGNPIWWPGKTENHCKFGGWMSNYPPGLWKNQGDCVSYYATNGHNPPNGPLAHLYPTP